jgi:hypothetical protein
MRIDVEPRARRQPRAILATPILAIHALHFTATRAASWLEWIVCFTNCFTSFVNAANPRPFCTIVDYTRALTILRGPATHTTRFSPRPRVCSLSAILCVFAPQSALRLPQDVPIYATTERSAAAFSTGALQGDC